MLRFVIFSFNVCKTASVTVQTFLQQILCH